MLFLYASAEGGPNGVNVSGGGEYDTSNIGGGATNTYTTTHAINGNCSYQSVSGNSGTGGYLGWDASMGSMTELWLRSYLNMPATYSGHLISVRSGSNQAARIAFNNPGTLDLQDGAGTVLATTTNATTVNSTFRVELHLIASASTTGGTLELRLFLSPNSMTPTEVLGPFTANQTASLFNKSWFGPLAAAGGGKIMYHDDDAISDQDWIGPINIATGAWFGA